MNQKKIKIILFISLAIFSIANIFYDSLPVQAAGATRSFELNDDTPKLQIPDLNVKFSPKVCKAENGQTICSIAWIGEYIAAIYKYAIGIVGILAAVVLMIGGVMWIIAGGSATMIGEAKAWIGASLTGLVIALTSYLILYQINPELTVFGPLGITQVEKAPVPTYDVSCSWKLNGCPSDWISADNAKCSGQPPATAETDLGSYYECCCQTLGGVATCKAVGSGNPPLQSGDCTACNDCETTTVPCKESTCLVNKALNTKLKNISFSGWQITEPWPPTIHHDDPCHRDGTCVDIAIKPATTDCATVNSFKAAVAAAGLSIYNEYPSCGGAGGGTGNHLHVK